MKNYTVTIIFEASSNKDAKEIKGKILDALWQKYPWQIRRPLEVYGPDKGLWPREINRC